MEIINTAVDSLLTPLGGIAIIAAIVAVAAGAASPVARWAILGLTIYLSSLAKFINTDGTEAPPLAFPFELLARNGRPLTIAALLLVVAFALIASSPRRTRTPVALYLLYFVNLFLALKIYPASPSFAILSLVVNTLVFLAMTRTVAGWLAWERDLRRPALALLLVGLIFCGSAFYQMRFDTGPIAFVHERLHGTTGNAQHAGVLLAAILPAAIYFLLRERSDIRRLLPLLALTAAIVYCLVWTGSRTAVIMAICGTGAFFVRRPYLLAILAIAGIAIVLFDLDRLILENVTAQRFATVENTRLNAWNSMFQTFLENPLLGKPVERQRVFFGESSWLAMAAVGGAVGLAPLCAFAIALGLLMFRVFRTRTDGPVTYDRDFVLAGWTTLMVGSVAEAYLLGVVSAPLIVLYLYALMGRRFLDTTRRAPAAARGGFWRPRTVAPAAGVSPGIGPAGTDGWELRRGNPQTLSGDEP